MRKIAEPLSREEIEDILLQYVASKHNAFAPYRKEVIMSYNTDNTVDGAVVVLEEYTDG